MRPAEAGLAGLVMGHGQPWPVAMPAKDRQEDSMTTDAAVWYRVSTGRQTSDNQVPEVEHFARHHGYALAEGRTYRVSESAWDVKSNGEYRALLQKALDDAWQGKFSVLIVWSLDRIVREGAEDALRIFRQFRERGCTVLSVRESWLNGSPEVQDILISFAGWAAERESARKSGRIRAGLARRKAEGKPVGGRKAGAKDRKARQTSGYQAAWAPGGARREAAKGS